MLNELVKQKLEQASSQYFNGNRVYDSAHFWCRKNKLIKLSNFFHKTAHKKPLNADFFLDYILKNIYKDTEFEFYEIPSMSTTYGNLLEVVDLVYNFEIQTKELLDQIIDVCSKPEINDQETIDLINRIFVIQRNYIDRICTIRDIVISYGNTPKDWIDISVRIDELLEEDYGESYG